MATGVKKIKVLTITTSGLEKKEGISTVILDYYSLFDKEKFQLEIIASGKYGPGLVREFQKAGIRVRFLPSRKKELGKYISALMKLLKGGRYSAIYIHGSSAIMGIELVLARMYGVKIRAAHSHNTTCDHNILDRLLRPVFYCSYTTALACGQKAGEWLFAGRKFNIVKNGRDIGRYRFDPKIRERMREKLGAQTGTLLVGHVGNFNRQKNQAFLVHVFQELKKIKPNSRLYLMGSGETEEQVKQLAAKLGLAEDIVFTGSIGHIPEMLQAMDVMALPSLYEGTPLVVIEWQIAGLPCLLSAQVTEECVFTDFVDAMPLDAGYRKWAEKMVGIGFADADRAGRSADGARAAGENGYDIRKNAEELQNLFISLGKDGF